MLARTSLALGYSTLALAAGNWATHSSSSWSTSWGSSWSSPSMTLPLPLPVPTASPSNSGGGEGSNFTSGLVAALVANNLTAVSLLIGQSADSLAPLLQGGPKTFFAPDDGALAAAALGIDPTTLLSYHITDPIDSASLPDVLGGTIVRTSLTDPQYVQLPNGDAQVLVVYPTSPPSDQVAVSRLLTRTTTTRSFAYENLDVRIVPLVLIPPPSLSTLLGAPTPEVNLTTFAGAQPRELVNLVNSSGITLFAPTNEALRDNLPNFEGRQRQEVVNVIANHFVNSSVLYSTNITDGLTTNSASGQPLSFASNSTGTFVTSNGTTSRFVRENIVVSNGVVHVIDSVLFNTAGTGVSASSSTTPTSTASSTASPSSTESTSSATPTDLISTFVSAVTSVTGAVAPTGRRLRFARGMVLA